MAKFIDLHTHSIASDGSMSPSELVTHAWENGLAAIAVTDHDTVDGIAEALETGKRLGIEVLAGVEISVDFEPEMHLLGYFLKDNYHNIESVLEELRVKREERNPRMIAKLNELGFDITLEEVEREAKGRIVARPHIASVLYKKRYVSSIRDAFDRYISDGKPAFVKKDKLTPKEGIAEIKKAGGIPVLAHPIFLGLTLEKLDRLVGELVESGLMGIETYYVEHSQEDTGNLLRIAIKHDIIPTGGSDFHGTFKPDIKIGTGRGNLSVPYEVLERMKKI